jgi:hypothetical protein
MFEKETSTFADDCATTTTKSIQQEPTSKTYETEENETDLKGIFWIQSFVEESIKREFYEQYNSLNKLRKEFKLIYTEKTSKQIDDSTGEMSLYERKWYINFKYLLALLFVEENYTTFFDKQKSDEWLAGTHRVNMQFLIKHIQKQRDFPEPSYESLFQLYEEHFETKED